MTDRHLRILALMARRSRRALDAHDASGSADDASVGERVALRARAERTLARLHASRDRRP